MRKIFLGWFSSIFCSERTISGFRPQVRIRHGQISPGWNFEAICFGIMTGFWVYMNISKQVFQVDHGELPPSIKLALNLFLEIVEILETMEILEIMGILEILGEKKEIMEILGITVNGFT